jgi:hypothetical protein
MTSDVFSLPISPNVAISTIAADTGPTILTEAEIGAVSGGLGPLAAAGLIFWGGKAVAVGIALLVDAIVD